MRVMPTNGKQAHVTWKILSLDQEEIRKLC